MFKNIDINIYIAALLSMLSTLFVQFIIEKAKELGKVDLYVKLVHTRSAVFNNEYGFYDDVNGIYMHVPMFVDFINNTKISKIIRNISLHAYMDDEEISEFVQIQRLKDKNVEGNGEITVIRLGDDEAYTFSIPEKGAIRANLEFMLHKNTIENEQKNFNKIVLTYSDEKDRLHAFEFLNVRDCWKIGEIEKNKEEKIWMKMKKNFKIHKK